MKTPFERLVALMPMPVGAPLPHALSGKPAQTHRSWEVVIGVPASSGTPASTTRTQRFSVQT